MCSNYTDSSNQLSYINIEWFLLGDHNLIPYNHSKNRSHIMMSNTIKNLSVSSSSSIGFEMEWHSLRSDKWYQSQGHGFESRECHCEGEIVGGDHNLTPYNYSKNRFAWHDVEYQKKKLSVSYSSPIGFEVEWHSSWSDTNRTQPPCNYQ